MSSLRILVFAQRFPTLSETFVIEQVRALIAAGAEVNVLTVQEGEPDVVAQNHPLFHVQALRHTYMSTGSKLKALTRFAWQAPFSMRGRRALAAAIRAAFHGQAGAALAIALMSNRGINEHHDVVLAHFGQTGVVASHLRRAGLLTGALATVFHGYDVSATLLIERLLPHYRALFRDAELCLPVSAFFGKRLAAWGCESDRIYVSRMGINPAAFPFTVRLPLPNRLDLLFVGRLIEKKGAEYAIRAMALVPPTVHLTIIGTGELEQHMLSLTNELGVGTQVTFLGKRSNNEVRQCLATAHAFLLPSVTAENGDMEGVPVALMEAMAVGAIAISTRHSGIPELIEHGRTGFLVEERDHVALASAIRHLSTPACDVAAIALKARQTIEKRFNSSVEARTLIERFQARLGATN